MFPAKQIKNPTEITALLNCVRLPGRLTTGESAVVLGVQEHDIPQLVAAKLLKPLGEPAPNAPKYFAATEIVNAAGDRAWLSRATRALAIHWKTKNARRNAAAKQL